MKAFRCEKHKPVYADTMQDAAEIFALRKAIAEFGRRAQVGALRMDCWAQDGRFAEFEAFIGRPSGLNQTTGYNVHFTVFAK